MKNKRLFVDQDGTLAMFHNEVNYLERMYEPGFFADLKPFENMVAGLELFRKQHPDVEVYILTSCNDSSFCREDKSSWIDAHLGIDSNHRIFTEIGIPKIECVPGGVTKDDYLLDDYNKNLNEFLFAGGNAIKCHNNINQRGLGAHGGSSGNLWVGPMVHTDDIPELIAVELAQHMGLEIDLDNVISAYPQIKFTNSVSGMGNGSFYITEALNNRFVAHEWDCGEHYSHVFQNPLNAIRYLYGDEDFLEYQLQPFDGENLSVPAFQLRAISSNLYQDLDFKSYLKADRSQFADDVQSALTAAKTAMVGQVNFLSSKGIIGDSVVFRSHAEMLKEIEESKDCGRPIEIVWFIPPTKVPEKSRSLAERILIASNKCPAAYPSTNISNPQR